MTTVPTEILAEVSAAAQRARVPTDIFNTLIASESSYNPRAYNAEYGAAGIAQFIPSTASARGVDPYNWKQSLNSSAAYLREIYDKNPNAGWLTAVGSYKGKSGSDSTKAQYAQSMLQGAVNNGAVQQLPDGVSSVGGLTITDSLAGYGSGGILKDMFTSKDGSLKLPDSSSEFLSGSILNYGLMGLGIVFIVVAGVRLSL